MGRALRGFLIGVLIVGSAPGSARAVSDMDLLLDKLVEKGVLTDLEAGNIRREITAQKDKNYKELAKEVVPKWAQNIAMSGDIRFRSETIHRDGSPDRNRQRARLRLGVKGKVTEQLEAGVRIATGAAGDPIGTNQSAQDRFDKKPVFFDQLYLKYSTLGTPLEAVPATIWGGKFENPFYATPLVWDGDVTFEGAAIQANPVFGPVEWFSAGGIFPLDEVNGDAADPILFAAQTGATWSVAPGASEEVLKHLKLKGAVAYYDYTNLSKTGFDTTSSNRFGNTALASSTATTTFLKFDINELDVLAELTSQLAGFPLKTYVDYVKNTAITENDKGWQLGVKVGQAKKPLSLRDGWEAGYYWERLEADAVLGALTDSDLGDGGTNRQGHVYYATLATMKNSTLGFKWFVTESVGDGDNSIDRLQVDWITKF